MSVTISPRSLTRRRITPCVLGCCGPRLTSISPSSRLNSSRSRSVCGGRSGKPTCSNPAYSPGSDDVLGRRPAASAGRSSSARSSSIGSGMRVSGSTAVIAGGSCRRRCHRPPRPIPPAPPAPRRDAR